MSLKICARTAVHLRQPFYFLRERSWSKTARERSRPLLELTWVVDSTLTKVVQTHEHSCKCAPQLNLPHM